MAKPKPNTEGQMEPQATAEPAPTGEQVSVEELLAMIGAKQVLIERQGAIILRQSAVIARQQEALAQLTPSESAEEQTRDEPE